MDQRQELEVKELQKYIYQHIKQLAQARLRSMKDSWWRQKADELQAAADRKGLKAVFGPRSSCSTPIYCSDGTLLTNKQQILNRRAEQFQLLSITFDPTV